MAMRKFSGKILVIDDDPNVLKILDLMLTQARHRVSTALRWDDALAILKKPSALEKPFDIIFLDLVLPGQSGFDVLRALKLVLNPVPPVVILTAMNDLESAVEALDLGASKYLTKPIDSEKLLKTVRELLSGETGSRF